jgi:ferrous iron transport protein B
VDATCLERNLNLVLQIGEITDKLVVCLNLVDEARRKNIFIDELKLSTELGVPVIPTVARIGQGLDRLKDVIDDVATGVLKPKPIQIQYGGELEKYIAKLAKEVKEIFGEELNPRWLALRLIDGDQTIISSIQQYFNNQEETKGDLLVEGDL